MKLLALDTATLGATVAVCDESGALAEVEREVTTHSEGLLTLIDQALQRAGCGVNDLDAVACGRGPGSFTGLRIGLATAKGLCLAAGKPLICVSSLQALAAGAAGPDAAFPRASFADLPDESPLVAALLDARRQEIFGACFRGGLPEGEEFLCAAADLPRLLGERGEAMILVGDGALLCREALRAELGERADFAAAGGHVIHARHLGRLALERLRAGAVDDLATVVPRYLRPTDAKLPAQRQDRG